jgi:photosystem II stability/assembly factor-like uncharacterized protein
MKEWARPAQVLALGVLAFLVAQVLPAQSPWAPRSISLAASATDQGESEENDDPYSREEHFYQQRAAPAKAVPAQALSRARQQVTERVRSGALNAVAQGDVRFSAVSESPWTSIGPQPIGSGFSGFGVGELPNSGRVSALAVVDANTVYLGAASGGVWKTTNGGSSWIPLTDGQVSLSVGAIAIDPTNPSTIYVGLGEQNFSTDSYYGAGILKSIDAGATWNLKTAPFFDRDRIGRIAVDPNNPSIVYAAANSGLAKSTDAGNTWARMCFSDCTMTDVVIDPSTNPSTVYLARGLLRGSIGGSAENGVYTSTTDRPHTSSSWTRLTGAGANTFPTFNATSGAGTGRIRLAITRTAQPTLYAIVHDVNGHKLMGVWKTTDGGANWVQTAHPETSAGADEFSVCDQCWYDLNIAVFPTDANIVYALAIELYRSTDGGASWTLISQGYTIPSKIHVDQHALSFIPGNPNGFYVGNDGGVYKSMDAGATFTNLNQGLSTIQLWRGAAHPTGVASAIGGSQDNGTLSFEGASSWYRAFSGDGGYVAIDFDNPQIVIGSTQNLGIRRSTAGPRGSFTSATNGIPSNTAEPRQFIAPIAMDPSNSRVLYAGTTRLYRSTNSAGSWSAISPMLASASFRFNAISAIAVAQGSPNTIYVGTGSSASRGPARLWVTTDDGTNWAERTAGLPNRTITSIAVDAANPTTAYVAVSGFDESTPSAPGHIFKTTNGGTSWMNVSGSLPNAPANAIVVDPADGQLVYVATDVGVFKSDTGGSTWGTLSTGLPNVVISDLVLNRAGTRLFAFSHGRGAYVADRSGQAVPTATPTGRATPTSSPVSVVTPSPTTSGRPSNDNFANAQVLALPVRATGTTLGATVEAGERTPGCLSRDGRSVWFRFTPFSSGLLTATTGGGSSFDTTLALYTGASLSNLVEVTCNDDELPLTLLTSRLTANVSAGVTYYLRLAGYGNAVGTYTLDVGLAGGPPTVGGRGLALSASDSSVALSWSPGTVQASYLLARILPQGSGFVPLEPTASSYLDATPGPSPCYLLLALDRTGSVIGRSDLFCAVRGTRSATGAPQDFTIQLNQSAVASLSWSGAPGGGQDAYVLLPLGGPASVLGGTATRTTQRLTGATCFILLPTRSGQALGLSDILCGVPGVSTLGADATGAAFPPSPGPTSSPGSVPSRSK